MRCRIPFQGEQFSTPHEDTLRRRLQPRRGLAREMTGECLTFPFTQSLD